MPLNPAVIFDRDGTLNRDNGYTWRLEDLAWNPGAMEAIGALNGRDVRVIVATNQSGVARGLYDEAAVNRFHEHMQLQLFARGARIDAFYYCPYLADAAVDIYRVANHPDRKPNPGMLLRAMEEWSLDPLRTIMIGDTEADMQAAAAAGVRGFRYEGGDLAQLTAEATKSF